jgi:tRNA threonylcarbamoyladenosine biosynthesis protein TsaE
MLEPVTKLRLEDATETIAIGKQLACTAYFPLVIFLEGDLGSGKTTLVRGFLRGLGYQGTVKSPTYTLVESYSFTAGTVYHFDLYRIMYPEELELIGIRDYFSEKAIVLIEWPEQGKGFLPAADVQLALQVVNEGRILSVEFLTPHALNLQQAFFTGGERDGGR